MVIDNEEWWHLMHQAIDDLALGRVGLERKTAYLWAARACTAQERGDHAPSPEDRRYWHEAACEYGHEAIEHAALSGDDEALGDVREVLDEYGVRV